MIRVRTPTVPAVRVAEITPPTVAQIPVGAGDRSWPSNQYPCIKWARRYPPGGIYPRSDSSTGATQADAAGEFLVGVLLELVLPTRFSAGVLSLGS